MAWRDETIACFCVTFVTECAPKTQYVNPIWFRRKYILDRFLFVPKSLWKSIKLLPAPRPSHQKASNQSMIAELASPESLSPPHKCKWQFLRHNRTRRDCKPETAYMVKLILSWVLGTGRAIKTDEFSEKIHLAFDPFILQFFRKKSEKSPI